jgi:hypothetical protein
MASATVALPATVDDRVGLIKGVAVNAMGLAAVPGPGAPFRGHVSVVVGMRSNEQMRGVAARWVIAVMAHQQTGRDHLADKAQGSTVGLYFVAIGIRDPIAVGVPLALPRPTAIGSRSVDLCPEGGLGRSRIAHVSRHP